MTIIWDMVKHVAIWGEGNRKVPQERSWPKIKKVRPPFKSSTSSLRWSWYEFPTVFQRGRKRNHCRKQFNNQSVAVRWDFECDSVCFFFWNAFALVKNLIIGVYGFLIPNNQIKKTIIFLSTVCSKRDKLITDHRDFVVGFPLLFFHELRFSFRINQAVAWSSMNFRRFINGQ